MLSHRERLKACLEGDRSLDRPPVALWRHFPVDDQSPEVLAASIAAFQNLYDFDLIKVTPASSFCLRDWGSEDRWEGHIEGTRNYTKRVIETPQDWESLTVLDPSLPNFADQLLCLRLIRNEFGPEVPVIQTIFSPLSQAKNLAGGERLIVHLRQFPGAVLRGLETITTTTMRFIEAALAEGIDGIFFAVQHAQASILTRDEYETFALPFDLQASLLGRDLWANILHLHGDNVYFDLATRYRFQIVNWHDRETSPTLAHAQKYWSADKHLDEIPVVCGGINRNTIVYGSRADVRAEALDAIDQTSGQKFILGTGCVVPVIASHGNIQAVRNSVEKAGREP